MRPQWWDSRHCRERKEGTRSDLEPGFFIPFETGGLEVNDGGAPPTEGFGGQMELRDIGSSSEESVDGGAQCTGTFAVNDTDAQDAPCAAGIEIIVDHAFDIAGSEGVKIENTVDGKFQRFRGGIERVVSHGRGMVWTGCPALGGLQ